MLVPILKQAIPVSYTDWRASPLCVPPRGLKHTWQGLGFTGTSARTSPSHVQPGAG